MPGTDGQVIRGIYDVANVQDRLRKYAQDKDYFRFWALRQVNTISLLKIISEKFGSVPAEATNADWKFRYPEFDELPYSFNLSANTAGDHTTLMFANEDAVVLNTSTRLMVDGIFTKSTVTDGATDMATSMNAASGIVLPEELRIINVGAEDSGGAGLTAVKVRRAHPSTSVVNAPQITTAMNLVVANIVARANDYPKEPISKNSKYLENIIQITRQSYGLGEHMVQGGGIETFLAKGGQEYLNIQYQLAETYVMKAIERAILVARKSEQEVSGNYEYETGGIREFILQDSDHYMNFGNKVLTVPRINNAVRRMADISGVKELWLASGTQLSEQMANAYEDKSIYYTNADLSVQYRMKVKTLESVGRDLIVHHITAPILNEIGMANQAFALNLSEYNYNEKSKFGCFQIAHKVPFGDYPKDAESFKSNEGFKGKWRELYGAWGMVRRLAETNFIWYGVAEPNN